MKRSEDRILTTHTGSLPREPEIETWLAARESGDGPIDDHAFETAARSAVETVARRQAEIGIDVIGDGEQHKPSYVTYVIDRLEGFGGERRRSFPKRLDSSDFPDWARKSAPRGLAVLRTPSCNGPIAWRDFDAVERDLARLRDISAGLECSEVFVTSASPGVIANMLPNEHYASREDYLAAIADAMRREYAAIVDAGFVLQIDCPDLAMSRNSEFSGLSVDAFVGVVEQHVEVLNSALAGLDPERIRMHLCWGNYAGPHNHDVPLEAIAAAVLRARPQGLVLEAANPRHDHEWKLWETLELPDGKILIPGCVDTTSNYVEHPELVAQRLVRYAGAVGAENVIAGTDCGFGSMLGLEGVEPSIAWAKLGSLVEGARLASQQLGLRRSND